MAKQIVWTKKAHQDRKNILLFWRLHNQSDNYSKKLNLLFTKAVKIISAHPKIGRKTSLKKCKSETGKGIPDFL